MKKYKGHPLALAEGKVLPTLSYQKLTVISKEIADMCWITKPLTFHIARHTFVAPVKVHKPRKTGALDSRYALLLVQASKK